MRAHPLMALPLLALGGCVEHTARVAPPADGGTSAIGRHLHAAPHAPVEERHGLPREIPVSAWRQDDDGGIARDELLVRTPTPWWQRFPCDIATDALWPGTLTAATEATPHPRPVPPADPAALAARARAAGYAAPAPAPTP